jgi:hypothetical protein
LRTAFRPDLLGSVLLATATSALLGALTQWPQIGWRAPAIVVIALVAATADPALFGESTVRARNLHSDRLRACALESATNAVIVLPIPS